MCRNPLFTVLMVSTCLVNAQSPGGVSTNIQLWLRAEGYTGGTTWADASGNSRVVNKTGTVPTTVMYNFQNVPSNIGASNYFSCAHTGNLNTSGGAIAVFAVGLPGGGTYSPFVSKTVNQYWDQGWILATSSPMTDIGFTTDNWTGTGSTNVAKQSGASSTIPYIASGFGDGASTNNVSVCSNGRTPGMNTSAKSSTSLPLYVGFDGDVYGFNGGSIAEVIMYNRDLNATERQRVWSYLAIKYGITLNSGGTNYLSSGSTNVWNITTNTGYNNNIFGIGRDSGSNLHQRQSVSINGGLQPVIGNGTGLVSLNSSGTNLGTDMSFLMAGSDNNSTNFLTYVSGLSAVNLRLDRIWKVQETGTVGTVTVAWPSTDAALNLLVSNDATFDGSDNAVSTTAITINGTAYRQASVDLTNGQFFTFGTFATAPGGVLSGLSLWVASDNAGVSAGSNAPDWDDLSPNKNHVETVGTRTLQAADAAHNFQPFFNNFSNTNHFKDLQSSLAPQNTLQASEVTQFGVVRINSVTNDGRIFGIDDVDNSGNDPGLSVVDASADFHRTSTSAVNTASPIDAVLNRTSLFSAYTSGTTLGLGMDGVYNTSAITSGGGLMGDILMVGYGNGTINGALPGDMQEGIWYKRALSATEIKQVESYLSIKHGTTLGGNTGTAATYNYLHSGGTTIWNKTTNAGFNNDIAAIGRDDASALNQKQSNSVNATNNGNSVTIALGSIAASNSANANTFTQDKSFLIWGSDGASHQTVYGNSACFTQLPTGVQARILRKWKVQITNFSQATAVGFLQSALVAYLPVSNLRLLMDDDGSNWSNATVITGAVSSGGRVVFSNVTFSPAQPYFTIATINYSQTQLPIELISFQGRTEGPVNELTWSTATEENNDHFELQRSTDGEHFSSIGVVDGAGDSQSRIDYAFTDADPANGMNHYRLKQVDVDGVFTYSSVIVLHNERSTMECIVRTLDVDGYYSLQCSVQEGAIVELIAPGGQPIRQARIANGTSHDLDLRPLASGMYFARVVSGPEVKTYKLLRP